MKRFVLTATGPNQRHFSALASVALLAACATTGGLSQTDVLNQYPAVANLAQAVEKAEAQEAGLFAPAGMAEAHKLLDAATRSAQAAKKDDAIKQAEQGLAALDQVDQTLGKARDELREVLTVRQRAVAAGAPRIAGKAFTEADKKLQETSSMVEKGKVEDARKLRPKLMESYAALELQALKADVIGEAKAAVARAESGIAKEYAPQTLQKAQQELSLISSVLEADRTQIDKAQQHARQTIWLSQRAERIAQLAKDFEGRDASTEDVLLWYQSQLTAARKPMGQNLPFDQPNEKVIQVFQDDYRSLLTSVDDLKAAKKETQDLMAAVQSKDAARIAALSGQLQAQSQTQAESERRYQGVMRMFDEGEGEVLRKGDDVLLQLYGFNFASGKSEIESTNYPLLQKVVAAIETFPGAVIKISGHTSSTGSKAQNLRLSEERATNVRKFLTEVGGIDASRIEVRGFGDEKPVASNKTPEGQAKNRRIEVVIEVPDSASSPSAANPS